MVSKVFSLCDAYESGMGHGLKQDGLNKGHEYFSDPEHAEAYIIGYESGAERAREKLEDAAEQGYGTSMEITYRGKNGEVIFDGLPVTTTLPE